MKETYLSVIIPSYNETENLKRGVLAEVSSYLSQQKYSWEVLVSDDGSPDPEARRLAKDFCAKNDNFVFLENEHGGKPFALWAGIQNASGKIVLFTDMDQSAPITQLPKLLPYYDQGYDLVIGSRGTERKNFSPFRLLASTIFRLFRQLIILPQIVDTQAGFKSLRRDVALKIFPKLQVIRQGRPKTQGWKVGSWDAELLFIADKFHYRIKEVPISWENRDLAMATKKSNNSSKFVAESLDMLRQIFQVRLNDLRGFYQP